MASSIYLGPFRATHKHKKTGLWYQEIGRALDCTNIVADENCMMVIYRNYDGALFVRDELEFDDGRFEKL